MFVNNFKLQTRGLVPVVGAEGIGMEKVPSYQVSGGVAAFLNWEGYCFRGGAEGTKVLELLLGDPSRTRVHHKATWRARKCLIAQLGWKEVWFAESERNEMVSEYIDNSGNKF